MLSLTGSTQIHRDFGTAYESGCVARTAEKNSSAVNQSISHAFAAPCEQVSDPLTGQADGKMQRPPFTETLTEGVCPILPSIYGV